MSDTKILQVILDKVTLLGAELNEFKKEVYARFDKVDGRIDKLGMQLAHLEDDAPTRDEFEKLQKSVSAV